ncbi:MAG TPA: glycoside hydrolase family 3 C-terminal domain-containing protein [Rhizomicrobium sp.]|jgi:beta-glucosidase
MRLSVGPLIAVLLGTGMAVAQPSAPWMDTSLTPDQRADLVLGQMTQAEELQLVRGYFGADIAFSFARPVPPEYRDVLPGTAGFVPGIARLGIPDLIETDAGEGIANNLLMRPTDRATALPSSMADAATWHPDLVAEAGSVIGAEARDRGFNVVLAGGLNLMRDPRGGRTFEYAGEDPLLAGTIAGAIVRGIESQHVISTLKHFAFNDQETTRFTINAKIDEAAARETDLLAFEIAIEQGHPGAIMCAYNRYEGLYACENKFLLTDVLKTDWTYPGWVLSDWGGVHSTVASVNAGLDQESAARFDGRDFFADPLKQALDSGEVTQARLHDMVHRILREMFAKGVMDNPPVKRASALAANQLVAERTAEESVVLLKNQNNILPLAKSVRRIAVIGSHADLGMLSGAGSSQVLPIGHNTANAVPVSGAFVLDKSGRIVSPGLQIYDPPSPLWAIQKEVPHTRLRYDAGGDIAQAEALARDSDVAIVFAHQWMSEGWDVHDLSLPDNQDALITAVASANPRTIVVLQTGGPVLMPWLDRVPAVLEAWFSGSGGAEAVADIIFGDTNPSGRLPVTFPASETQLPHPKLQGGGDFDYFEGADVGYKWFAAKALEPLFPFGFGLSYTHFTLSGLQAEGGNTISAKVTVSNDGPITGKQTVELYVTPPQGPQCLVGWTKIDLKPGEMQTVTITADPRLLAHFDTTAHLWRIATGDYLVSAGSSSATLPLQAHVALMASELRP